VVFLGFWFILQFFEGSLALAASPQTAGVAWFAHVGGFVFGVVFAWLARSRVRRQPGRSRPEIWIRSS
jgi:membrane associated rhomboid family serine protease